MIAASALGEGIAGFVVAVLAMLFGSAPFSANLAVWAFTCAWMAPRSVRSDSWRDGSGAD